jgi:chitodextrinase
MKKTFFLKVFLLSGILIFFGNRADAQCDHTDDFKISDKANYERSSGIMSANGWKWFCCNHTANKEQLTINGGRTSTPVYAGYITSPIFTDGCNRIQFSYSTSVGTSLKLEILQANTASWSTQISVTADNQWHEILVDTINIKGEFQLQITNLSNGTAGTGQKVINIKDICLTAPVIPIPPHTYAISAPKDATVFVGVKDQTVEVAGNFLKMHYIPFTERQAVHVAKETDTSKIWYYNVSGAHNYRVYREGALTHVGTFTPKAAATKAADTMLVFTNAQLTSRSPKEVDHDVSSLAGRNMADIYLNINAQGYLTLPLVADTAFQLINLRNWQAINNDVSNYFIEPDFHYSVTDESGTPSSSVVTVDSEGLMRPVGAGTAIVRVTYDAMVCDHTTNVGSNGNAFFGALWPENTGVLVVSVGAPKSGITPNMTLSEYWAQDSTDKADSIAIDAEMDVLYYEADKGSFAYTFHPEGVTSVTLALPTLEANTLSYSGFSSDSVTSNADGSYTVRLVHGRNIVKLTSPAGSTYQVLSAKPVTYTVSTPRSGELFGAGDTISVTFSTLYHPCNKLSGIYNMTAGIQYTGFNTNFPLILGPGQYTFASRAQTYRIIIPKDYAGDEVALTNGVIKVSGFGSAYGAHRNITKQSGVAPNLNAGVRLAYFGSLPSFYFRLTDAPETPKDLAATPDGDTAISLTWTPSRDNGSVAGYAVYLNGAFVEQISATSYRLQNLTPGTRYLVEVESVDDKGTPSSAKAQATAVTLDFAAPTVPANLTAEATESAIKLAWSASSDNSGVVAKYVVYLNNDSATQATDTTCTLAGLTAAASYAIKVAAVDAAGNASAASEPVTVVTPDQTAPSSPGGLRKVSATATSVTLAWTASTDNVGVAGYLVTLNGDSVSFVTATTCTVSNLLSAYLINVYAVDAAGNRSAPAYHSGGDNEAPTAPTNLAAVATETSITLTWTASTDNLIVAGYIVYLNGDSVAVADSAAYTFANLSAGTGYKLAVAAFDAAGNRSEKATLAAATLGAATGILSTGAARISVYPNPFAGYIIVEAASDGRAEIYDISGRKVLAVAVKSGSNRIETSALAKGVYVLRIGAGSAKIVK